VVADPGLKAGRPLLVDVGEGHRDRGMVLVGPVRMVRGMRIDAGWIRASDGLGAIGLRRVMGASTVRVAVPKPIVSQRARAMVERSRRLSRRHRLIRRRRPRRCRLDRR